MFNKLTIRTKQSSKTNKTRSVQKRRSVQKKRSLKVNLSKKKKTCMKNKVGLVMKEFKEKTLRSSAGQLVTNPKQGIAIALSVARKTCKI